MRLFILGANGRIGLQLIEQALARNHQVTAFVRSPQKIQTKREGFAVVTGDPRSTEQLTDALRGQDAILSALGPRAGGPITLLGDCAKSTVSAAQAVGVSRLIFVSAAFLFRDAGIPSAILRNIILRKHGRDSEEMERVVIQSGLDWTIVRPPRLTNAARTERYRYEDGRLPRGGFYISRADVAHFMIGEVEHPAHTHQIVGVCK